MSETWTEYAVLHRDGVIAPGMSYKGLTAALAAALAEDFGATVVGRTVTASDWLPVDTDGAK